MRKYFLLALPVLLSACGPVYETSYSFIPPTKESGQTCVFQCEMTRNQCFQLEEMKEQNCEMQSKYEYDRCQRDLEARGKKEKWYDCSYDSCSADTERCESLYRSCYSACGGTVQTHRVCTMFCDKVPASERGY